MTRFDLLSIFILLTLGAIQIFARFIEKKSSNQARRFLVTFFINNLNVKGNMELTLTTIDETTGLLTPVDAKGKPSSVEAGSVLISSTDESVFTVEKDATNELAFKVTAVGVGTAQLNYSGDADLGDGVKTITGSTTVTVTQSEAVGFTVTFSNDQATAAATT